MTSSPAAREAAATSSTGRGPKRSTARPLTDPSRNQQQAVTPNTIEVAPLPVPNSAAIGAKNAPKLYATPKTTAIATNAAATVIHPLAESRTGSATGRVATGGAYVAIGPLSPRGGTTSSSVGRWNSPYPKEP